MTVCVRGNSDIFHNLRQFYTIGDKPLILINLFSMTQRGRIRISTISCDGYCRPLFNDVSALNL